jgi:hypothetical protein
MAMTSSAWGMQAPDRCTIVLVMQFPDSTFAALRIATDRADESASWGRLLALAIVLTIAAVSAGLLAGG